jgi:hypothetical protein
MKSNVKLAMAAWLQALILGISAGKKRIPLPRGKSADFRARDWKEPFPVKIFLAKSMTRSVFSSKWPFLN